MPVSHHLTEQQLSRCSEFYLPAPINAGWWKPPNYIISPIYSDCALLSSLTAFLIETKPDRRLGLTSRGTEHCKGTQCHLRCPKTSLPSLSCHVRKTQVCHRCGIASDSRMCMPQGVSSNAWWQCTENQIKPSWRNAAITRLATLGRYLRQPNPKICL